MSTQLLGHMPRLWDPNSSFFSQIFSLDQVSQHSERIARFLERYYGWGCPDSPHLTNP